jgi:hypothetical protein
MGKKIAAPPEDSTSKEVAPGEVALLRSLGPLLEHEQFDVNTVC